MNAAGRTARIRLSGLPVGRLVEVGNRYEFRYDDSWLNRDDAVPISLTMPLSSAPYTSQGLHPFFENLLPEGWLLDISTAKLKLSRGDVFGILLACCADCFGAVEVIPEHV